MFEKGINCLNHFNYSVWTFLASPLHFRFLSLASELISILQKTKLFPAQLSQKVALVFLFDPSIMLHYMAIDIYFD